MTTQAHEAALGNRDSTTTTTLGTLGWIAAQGPGAIGYVLVAAVLGLIPMVAVPLAIRLFVDRYLVSGDTQWGVPVQLVLVGAAITSTVLTWLQYSAVRRFAMRLTRDGYFGFTWHALRMPIPALERLGVGDLQARINARQRMSYYGGALLPMALVNVVNTVAFAAILFVLDPYVGLVAIAVVAAMALVTLVLLRWRRSLQKRADDDYTALAGHTARILESIESIKAAAWEQHVFGRWARRRARSARSVSRLGVADQFLALIPAVAMALGLGVVLAVASWQVVQGEMTVGSLVAAQSFVALLLGSAGMVSMMGGLVQHIVSSARQSDVVFREPLDPEVQPRDVTASSPTTSPTPAILSGAVEVRGLTFGYVPAATPLIDRLDLSIPPGARVALVGRTGSGKTTIAKLVVGELQPWSGEVSLDGVARLHLDRATIVRSVAYVPQQSVLFPGTIRENLTLWDTSITDDALHRAITDACISAAIAARPGGLHARVASEESGFSGGEMQRLSLARALVNDPKVLVLDEATSALDPVVEHQVDANLRRRGCTCLIVAHRLSTVRDADEIVVLERGRIVQRGQYDDIKDHGFFSELIHG